MKNYYKPILLLFVFASFSNTYGQILFPSTTPPIMTDRSLVPEFKRFIKTMTSTQTIFSVAQETDMEKIANIDLVKMMAEDLLESTEIIIDFSNLVTITNINHHSSSSEYDYQHNIAKTVSNQKETILYDYSGTVISRTLNDQESSSFMLSGKQSLNYGLYDDLFERGIDNMASQFREAGYFANIFSGNILMVIGKEMEIYIDFEELSIETLFFENKKLIFSQHNFFEKDRYHIIPLSDILVSYDELPSGIKFQKMEIKTYLRYGIVNEFQEEVVNVIREDNSEKSGSMQIHQFEEISKENAEIKIYPNPATTSINIELPDYLTGGVNIGIVNLLGQMLIAYKNVDDKQQTIDISDLRKGVYFLRCEKDGKSYNVKFIKQ